MPEPKWPPALSASSLLPPKTPAPKFHFLEKARGRSWGLQEPVGDEVVQVGGKTVRHALGLEMEQSGMVSLEPESGNQQAQVTSGRIWWKKSGKPDGRTQAEGWRNTKGKQE